MKRKGKVDVLSHYMGSSLVLTVAGVSTEQLLAIG